VVDNLSVVDGVAHWNVVFTRYAQDWEVDMVLSFYERLYSNRIWHRAVDRLVWNLSKRGIFEVKTLYKALASQEVVFFPWKSIWRVKSPKRVFFFVWTTALGKILTHDNLRRHHIVVVEWCCMCKKNVKSIDHLFLHYDVACAVWSFFYSLFGVEWVMPRRMLDLLSGWGTSLGHGQVQQIWKQVPLCVMWGLWCERNARVFEDVELPVLNLCRNVLNTLFVWALTYNPSRLIFAEFLHSFTFVSFD
jgi:hypothetical protein